jgi:hypothetical protein
MQETAGYACAPCDLVAEKRFSICARNAPQNFPVMQENSGNFKRFLVHPQCIVIGISTRVNFGCHPKIFMISGEDIPIPPQNIFRSLFLDKKKCRYQSAMDLEEPLGSKKLLCGFAGFEFDEDRGNCFCRY